MRAKGEREPEVMLAESVERGATGPTSCLLT
jgi:hypothetical protein